MARVSGAGPAQSVTEEVTSTSLELVGPPRPTPALTNALHTAMERRPREVAQVLTANDLTDRERLLALLRLTAGVGEKELQGLRAEEVAPTLEQLRRLHDQLRRRAPLRIERLVFCRAIQGFGQYQPLPARHAFQAGCDRRPGERVQVYAEVRQFTTLRQGGAYQTNLKTTLEVRDSAGRRVAALDLGGCIDHCQSPREDYFLNIQFNVPAGLAPGLYTLWVGIEDLQAPVGRGAKQSLDFRVCPPG